MTRNDPIVIHEAEEFVVLSKPAGLLMHALPNARDAAPTLADWLIRKYPEMKTVGDDPAVRPGIVHRLDKDTSGILLACRTEEFFRYAKELFQTHAIRKRYLALTRGHVERGHGIIDRPLGVRAGTTRRSVRSSKMRKDAVTEYEVIVRAARGADEAIDAGFKSTLLSAFPRTGRTHQIRVHLTAIGHPILGDSLYGPKLRPAWISRFMLHAYTLEFPWGGEARTFKAPPDRAFLTGIENAGIPRGKDILA